MRTSVCSDTKKMNLRRIYKYVPSGSIVAVMVLTYTPCLLCKVRNDFKFSPLVELEKSRQTFEHTTPFRMCFLFTSLFFFL